MVHRSAVRRAVDNFLQSAERQPSGLVIEGEAGIGKTTVWLDALDRARRRGFRVLSARMGPTDFVLPFAALADLLSVVEPELAAQLSDTQRLAIDRVLLRDSADGPATNEHTVAAAIAVLLNMIAADSPLIVAVDNVHWLDPSSRVVLAFAVRHLDGRVGMLVTERCDPDRDAAAWLQLSRPGGMDRIEVGRLSLGGLHAIISKRLGRSFSRPVMTRIANISGGNPFYALELARAIDLGAGGAQPVLPTTLAELMRMRIGDLDSASGDALLAAASVPNPTIELVATVLGMSQERTVELLEESEDKGIVTIAGNLVRFSHPLLAQSIYSEAKPARRRAVHRRLADVQLMPELRARHMALAAATADSATLDALDDAADTACARGAPAAAAELLDLAMSLGGDTPVRRVRAAEHHFRAGDADRARGLLEPTIDGLEPGVLRSVACNLMAGIQANGDRFVEAGAFLEGALADAQGHPGLQARTLMSLAFVQAMTGEFDAGLSSARQAVEYAEQDGSASLLSQALATLVNTQFHLGQGVDEATLQRALELEDPAAEVPISFSASAIHALTNAWTGRLGTAARQMAVLRERCVERGAEVDLMAITGFCTLIAIWRGDFTEAAVLADETRERAEQVGGSLAVSLAVRAAVAAYSGREADARADAAAALRIAEDCGSARLAEWPIMTLGFLEVSLGRYEQALTTLQPMLDGLAERPGIEIMTGAFLADAVEAMIALGRHSDAEPLIEALERTGTRLSRQWMIAVGARCRSMWLAATGDVPRALTVVQDALVDHAKVPMPFECARTQLLLGQLERRQRHKEGAVATLRAALQAFENMGTPLWADRARAELARVNVAPTRDMSLTHTEQRVAQLAAAGKTNRDLAAALFVSPKTVEAHLSRIYRKLGIGSRAELGRVIGNADSSS
ncbi:helix-turn-helix transcriptional regulator [Mycobacterium sp. IDR2000157661]|uniref:helix-turn-helix transcriptional regulator n=1 Tax=Mycobacterium sp. IDR2000157661 TaxID=2867005 RepID=UPI00351D176E